jgi:hypothetical protein
MVSWLVRLVRVRRLDRSPLRRATDRLETVVLAVLVAAFVAGTPFAALAAGGWAHAAAHREQLAQLASEHKVSAVVQEVIQLNGGDLANDTAVLARWTAPDGKPVTGDVLEPSGSAPGEIVQVWLARDGQVAQAPLLDSQVSGEGIAAEICCGMAGLVLLIAACMISRLVLDKRRMADWDAEWRAAGPRWTTRA